VVITGKDVGQAAELTPARGRSAAADLPSRASLGLRADVTEAELEYHQCQHMLSQRAVTRNRRERSRRDGAGNRGQLPQAELQNCQRQQQAMLREMTATRGEISRRDDVHGGAAPTRPLSRYSNFSDEITEGTRQGGGAVKVGPWGGPGGQPFYMRGGGGAPRLLSVSLYHADTVHGFRFEYLLGGVRRTMGPSGRHYKGSKGLRATVGVHLALCQTVNRSKNQTFSS
jgi:hypothetical protein